MYQTISKYESLQPVTYQIDTKRFEKSQIKDSAKEQYKSVTNLYLPRNDKNCICTSVPNVNTQEAKTGR
ncbi:hypothetical protein F3B23_13665 [Bacteroides fragilis]|uniref:Uncharacterized protein n=1 Tax=Bacteroides fragilis TaxID=817 RepID=A0A5M5P406_BACFG|nr:hypothetical protein F3B28_14350 [Bacteroides fragilis]KAA4707018.1 hypothetical protein F3B27_16365 [Bacteroides fragilis]KAA4719891.1 hypothetical protein F3B32_09465 [Bacteroides fragilis]KAA4724346.1 hypothetical protein F3B30_20560 [Bacteroides fragilis]KAA4726167.1 hypothetical protein F3B31_20415 [Bacteroides fragilis]